MEIEEWRPVVGSEERFEVSNFGRVKRKRQTFWYKKQFSRSRLEYILNQFIGSHGYYSCSITGTEAKSSSRTVHSLVAEAFLGPRLDGHEVCHNDGNKLNNRLDNLRYDTAASNAADRKKHGRDNSGEKQGRSKLKSSDISLILELRNQGIHQKVVAEMLGVGRKTISHIELGKTWQWLTGLEQKPMKKGPTGARNQR